MSEKTFSVKPFRRKGRENFIVSGWRVTFPDGRYYEGAETREEAEAYGRQFLALSMTAEPSATLPSALRADDAKPATCGAPPAQPYGGPTSERDALARDAARYRWLRERVGTGASLRGYWKEKWNNFYEG